MMSEKSPKITPIKPAKFYKHNTQVTENLSIIEKEYLRRRRWSLEPKYFWHKYYKQVDALEAAVEHSTDADPLCVFCCQDYDKQGCRSFLVAHPEKYWNLFIRKLPRERCTYEVIPQGAPCWLYLDLEFDKSLNPDSNGVTMTKILIEVLCAFIKKYWKYRYTEDNVLNLDSTTEKKFSRHLIFCTKEVAFQDNLHIGRFIKSVVNEIDEYVFSNGSAYHDVLSYYSLKGLKSLFVETDKRRKIFVDTVVYSKNRHFRIYKATKFGKFSHLEVAPECSYEPTMSHKEKDLAIFLDSLVSYLPDKSSFTLLEFNDDSSNYITSQDKVSPNSRSLTEYKNQGPTSPFPFIDEFIAKIIQPGHIRTCVHFESSKTIIYEILGNRYCANIKRAHKSNNIYFVVDLVGKIFYQKCHDVEDCYGFKSNPLPLPTEVAFLLDDEDDEVFLAIPDASDGLCSTVKRLLLKTASDGDLPVLPHSI